MSFGSTIIGGAKYGNIPVYTSGPASTDIPYIRGGADGSYIDTGITADNTVKVVIWARNWGVGASQMFGCREGATQNTFLIANYFVDGSNTGSINLCYAQSNATYVKDQFHNLGGYHKYEYYGGTLKVDDVVVGTAPSGVFSNSLNIHIFGFNNNGSHIVCNNPFDVCKAEIWKSDALVRRFTAVNTPSVGLYDSVSGTLFTNAGSGAFSYGTFDLSEYTPLQYVECSDTSYIDTGILGTNVLPIAVKFRPSGAAAFRFLLGARTSSSSGRLEFRIGDATTPNKVYTFCYNSGDYLIYNVASQTGNDLVWTKTNNISRLNNSQEKLGSDATGPTGTFSTTYPLFVGALNSAGNGIAGFLGRIYYAGFGGSGNFVPMLHNGVAGLYEMYSDTFHPSLSANPFVAGPSL